MIKPYGDQILIQPDGASVAKVGSLFIPDTAKEAPVRGTVLAAGPGKHSGVTGVFQPTDPMLIAGAVVLYGKYEGTAVDGCILVREPAVLAVIAADPAPDTDTHSIPAGPKSGSVMWDESSK